MNRVITYVMLTALLLGWVHATAAAEGWQANINVSSGPASARLTFGQMSDATDANDGLYDVPALLSGSLQAYFSDGRRMLWRDIRSVGSGQEWSLVYEANGMIFLKWDPKSFPEDENVELIDTVAGKVLNMKQLSSYSPGNTGKGELVIRISGM